MVLTAGAEEGQHHQRSKVLVVGATGHLGRELVWASVAAGHPTFALVRELGADASRVDDGPKAQLLRSFAARGVTLLKGSLQDFTSLLEAVRLVDVVISAVSSSQVPEQKLLVQAIKEAGCIKRFLPSEFGVDCDKVQVLDMAYEFYKSKAEIRRCIEKEGIPYTYISCSFFMRYLLPSLMQPDLSSPPKDEIKIFGHGDVKAVFVKECDIASFTICAMDDPRTLNKVLYLRPPGNVCTQNQIVESWEVKTGKKLAKVYVTEEQLLKNIQETPFPSNMGLIFIYSSLIKGDQTYFDIESSGLDGNKLYPHLRHTTVDEFLDSMAKEEQSGI